MARLQALKDRLARYQKLEDHILTGGQEYTIGNTPHKMADIRTVQTMIANLEKRINRVEGRQNKVSNINLSTPGGQA